MHSSMPPIRAIFVMEQHLGHFTYYQNLRRFIESGLNSAHLEPSWVEVTYTQPGSLFNRLPLPPLVKGSLIGRAQVRRGLQAPHTIAFFNSQVPAVLAGAVVQQSPYILSTDITPLQYDAMAADYGHGIDKNGLIRKIKHQANLALFQHAARILAWSDWARQSLIADYHIAPNRVEVLPPGVDMDLWQPSDRPEPVRQEPASSLASAPLRILFVGGDFSRKGGDLLLQAFRRLPPGTAELLMVTRTPVAPEPGVTIYSNLRPNDPALRALYRSADVFALPSRAEAFGIAAIEAAAAGLPALATQVGGLTEIVLHGQTGLLFPPGNVDALSAALHQLAADPLQRWKMGQAARARVETHFDARRNAARVLEILEETVQHAWANQHSAYAGKKETFQPGKNI